MKTKMTIKNQTGAAIVEFAIVLPLVIMLLAGITEFGLLMYNKAMITNASREGARFGSTYAYNDGGTPGVTSDDTFHPPNSEIQQTVVNYLQNFLITWGSDTILANDTDIPIMRNGILADIDTIDSSGDELTVIVNYQYDFLIFPNFAEFFGGPFEKWTNLQAVTLMRME